MRIDLHAHTSLSDGTQSPTQLVHAAASAGLDVLALTDHDTTSGWAEALRAADLAGISLLPGIEISTAHRGRGVHLLAYLPDPAYPPLVHALDGVLEGRTARVPAIVERLQGLGVPIEEGDVRRAGAGSAATGRPHVADALVARGVVADRREAFDRFLKPGRPAYVHRTAADLTEMVGVVARAGGVSVLAHPWGRSARSVLDAEAIARLAEAGLGGLEVDHEDHVDADRAELRRIAEALDLLVTGSSDHHGLGKVGHALGCNVTAPEQYERLLAAAEESAARAGRGAGRR